MWYSDGMVLELSELSTPIETFDAPEVQQQQQQQQHVSPPLSPPVSPYILVEGVPTYGEGGIEYGDGYDDDAAPIFEDCDDSDDESV